MIILFFLLISIILVIIHTSIAVRVTKQKRIVLICITSIVSVLCFWGVFSVGSGIGKTTILRELARPLYTMIEELERLDAKDKTERLKNASNDVKVFFGWRN